MTEMTASKVPPSPDGGPGAKPAGRGLGVAPPKNTASEQDERSPRVGDTHERADDGIRTRDPHLGKVMRYQLRHVRNERQV
jgi:hypothetical protein